MRIAFLFGVLLPFSLLLAGSARGQTPAKKEARGSGEDARLEKFFADDWDYWMKQYPEFATAVGYPGQNARWTDFSAEAIAARGRHLHEALGGLEKFERAKLTAPNQLNYDLYHKLLENAIEGMRFRIEPNPFASVSAMDLDRPINQLEGVQQDIARVVAFMPTDTVKDYENIIARINGVPAVVDQMMALMQEGLARHATPPRITLRDVPKQIESQIFDDPMASPLLHAFAGFPKAVPEAEQARLRTAAVAAYRDKFVPAFRKLHDYLEGTYIPGCRETIAAEALPDGKAYYEYEVRWHTTTNLTPQQIHEIGLAEVQRIRAEMNAIIAKTGFQGSFHDFAEFLRTDPRFFFTDADDLVLHYRDITKRIDPQLPHLFGKLPRLTYGVKPVPAAIAPSQTTAYYQPGSPAAGRAGTYFVNTYDLKQRPKFEMEALSMHESVPGHHLQIALAQEMEGVPEFRREIGYTAYVEGWALYAESLGDEMGFYTDPYSKFAQLTYEMWRAIRLVVDTGMHAMGWTRDQAIQYFRDNAGKADHDIIVEVDRYIVWPGQALGYKIGQMKIRELRNRAEGELGPRFDIRAFHDEVLAEGAVPLDVLEARINAWIAAEKAKPEKKTP